MKPTRRSLSRRRFLAASSSAALGMALNTPAKAAFTTTIHRAKIIGKSDINPKMVHDLKAAGFDGVEVSAVMEEEEAKQARAMIEGAGLKVHSVLRGWAEFNSEDPGKVAASYEVTEKALRTAHWLGAETILLVPCRVGGVGVVMPQPWDFDIEFDPKNGLVSRVVKGDNAPYTRYIQAQNRATETSKEQVKKLIPLAEQLGIIIGLENVWNNLWVRPDLYQNFVASFNHPFVKAYYDVGNHVKYLIPVHDWIHTLGPLIKKIHIKDYLLAPDQHSGKFVHPRDGSIDWPKMRQALEDVGYNGWITVEDGGLPLPEFVRRLDLIIAGK